MPCNALANPSYLTDYSTAADALLFGGMTRFEGPGAGKCDQCWYCSTECREQHWSNGQAGAACQIPHSLTCPVLSLFGGSKCDADMESVLHMCLDALALQTLQQAAPGTCTACTFADNHGHGITALHTACPHVALALTLPQATSRMLCDH